MAHRFDPTHVHRLDNPERRKSLPPEQLLEHLPINQMDDILDIGAGTGYFTFPAAEKTSGTVFALDVEPKMLEILQQKLDDQSIHNVKLLQGEIEHLPLEDAKVDHVIASLVLHEVDPLEKGLSEIARVLKPGGHLFCLDWEKVESEQGPPLHHRIHSDDIKQAMKLQGFELIQQAAPTPAHYLLIARKE